MTTPLLPGDRVEGKSKKLAGRRGVVLLVSKESRMRSYKVQWDSGVVESVSARSIRREVGVAAWTPPDLAQIARLEEGDAGADVADSSSDMSISSSSSEGESVCAASSTTAAAGGDCEAQRAETERDESVYAHGRKWVHRDAVFIDPAGFVPARKASLHWPLHLQLGTLVRILLLSHVPGGIFANNDTRNE
ncbi:hypothetical protein F443_20189 [Phytophthora nicotianae P1569]|uniref:Uncharacterized protein n=1 Tax=Phytophthora nicotianae P1569 TaxID=1317065 RepID=V9E470_PHYNI|nr:hypothetical protein F443_20189 [Phytophthora nicotianae P1569]